MEMQKKEWRPRNICTTMVDSSRQRELERIEKRLAELAVERQALESARAALAADRPGHTPAARFMLTQQATPEEKVRLFRSLFRGRTDVHPVRWENKSSGKRGYAPACSNECVRGICEKPRIKCSECPNQAFIAVSDSIVERHLRGEIVAGVYPLLPDSTSHFVAVTDRHIRARP